MLHLNLILIYLFSAFAFAQGEARRRDYQSWYPTAPGVAEGFFCSMGDAGSCQTLSRESLARLDECAPEIRIDGSVGNIGYLLLNQYGEATFFQELATRNVKALRCQQDILRPEGRGDLSGAAWQVYQTQQNLIRRLFDRKKSLSDEYDSWSLAAADPRTAGVSGATAARNRLLAQMNQINSAVDGLLAQVPFGSHEQTRNALRTMSNRNVTRAEFERIFTSSLDGTLTDLNDGLQSFTSRQDVATGRYDLTFDQKKELWFSPGSQGLMDQIDPQRVTLGCRFNRCFESGPRNARIATFIGLSGATILTAGTATPFVAAAAITATSVVLSGIDIQQSCFRETTAINTDQTTNCSSAALAQMTINKVDGLQCASSIAMGLLEGVPVAQLVARARAAGRLIPTRALFTPKARTHLEPHFNREAHEAYVRSLIARVNRGDDVEDIIKALDNPDGRAFRSGKQTTYFDQGVTLTPDEVIARFNRGEGVSRSGTQTMDPQIEILTVQHRGISYEVQVCRASPCTFGKGAKKEIIDENEVRTVYPTCGPGVRRLVKLSDARAILQSTRPLSMENFVEPATCP